MRTVQSCLVTISVLAAAVAGTSTAATAASIKVHEGESIQAAIDAADPGDKIIVYAGTYVEPHTGPALRVNKPLQLIGKVTGAQRKAGQKVHLVAGPGQTDGVLVEPANEDDPPIVGFRIKGFTIEGFPNNGIHLRYVKDFRIENNESIANEENGIFPTLSADGLVKRNLSYGSADSALWVEASENVRVLQNVLHSSPTGLEVTVSNNIEITDNEVYNNTIGIGLYHPSSASLPPLAEMKDWVIRKNWIHDNNAPNTAPVGSMPGSLPSGGGLLVLGTDRAFVEDNLIENNDFFGVAVVDYCVAVAGTRFDCEDFPPDINPRPEQNVFTGNTILGNGTAPDPDHSMAPYAADITYIMLEPNVVNRFCGNEYGTKSYPFFDPIELARCG